MLRVSTLLIIAFSILLLFLFPAAAGSFSAVHGPVTAMRASRIAMAVHGSVAAPNRAFALGMQSLVGTLTIGPMLELSSEAASRLAALRC